MRALRSGDQVVGPGDGHGGDSLVRITFPAHARIGVDGRPAVTLGPDEALHVPRDTWHRVEGLGAAELPVLAVDGQR